MDFSQTFIYSDQPTTCVKCGARTAIILDFSHTKHKSQIHKCNDIHCGFEFLIQYDEAFENSLAL